MWPSDIPALFFKPSSTISVYFSSSVSPFLLSSDIHCFVFFPLPFFRSVFVSSSALQHVTVALILWPWINIIYQGRVMFAALIQTGVTLVEKWHSTATGLFVFGEPGCAGYVIIPSAFQVLPFLPAGSKQPQPSVRFLKRDHRSVPTFTYAHQESGVQVPTLPLIKAHLSGGV